MEVVPGIALGPIRHLTGVRRFGAVGMRSIDTVKA